MRFRLPFTHIKKKAKHMVMKAFQWIKAAVESNKPLLVMVVIQIIYAGQSLFSKAAITEGMKPPVFVAYRQAMATLVLAPFALFFESKKTALPPLKVICKIFFVSLFGITVSLNLGLYGMKYISATFATALVNTISVMVFILAVVLRIETLNIKQWNGIAKVLGSVIGLSGAMVMTFYRGPPLYADRGHELSSRPGRTYTSQEWIKGSLLMLGSSLAWSSWLIMQTPILKEYPAKLRLTTMQCCFSSVISAVYGAAVERNVESWKLGCHVNLISVVYCGIVVTGLSYWLQVWIVEKKGPVYTAIFSPLALILTAIFSAIIFKETLHWGSILGAIILVAGLYSYLWGKSEEAKMLKQKIVVCEEKSNDIIIKTGKEEHTDLKGSIDNEDTPQEL